VKAVEVQASPAHVIVCAHALFFGALAATGKLLVSGELSSWAVDFESTSKDAAESVSISADMP